MELRREACFIDGRWITNDRWMEVDDPATGRSIGRVPLMGAEETEMAVEAARAAFPAWSARTAGDRAEIVRRFYFLVKEHADALARLLSAEQGKPVAEALAEIDYAAAFLEWFGEEAKRVNGEIVPGHRTDKRIIVMRQPIGVVAAITPWNFPAAMVTRKIGPALAAGCTAVLKPAEQTPFTALALAALADEAGVPPGAFNVVTGDPVAIGGVLTSSPVVRKLSFTGSTATGAKLMAQCAPTIKKLSLELGGNAPFVVFDDADLDAAVEGAMAAKYRNTGQACIAANRFYVQAGVHDRFIEKFDAATRQLVVGPASEPSSVIGPLIDGRAIAKVEEHIADAVAKGATVVTGGSRHAAGATFFEPTILSGVTADMRAIREETFGPVAPVIRFETEAEAIRLVNDTPFGLAAYLYTRDISRAWRMSEAIETGMIGLNTGLISTAQAPFGGIKASGLGREGGHQGMDEYLEVKYVCLNVG